MDPEIFLDFGKRKKGLREEELKMSNFSVLSQDFSNTMLGLAFNRTDGLCPRPLARTSDPARFYAGISHCGMQCEDPFLASRDVSGFHIVVLTLAIVCVIFNAFGLVSGTLSYSLVIGLSLTGQRRKSGL
jgi:hypothetical protein